MRFLFLFLSLSLFGFTIYAQKADVTEGCFPLTVKFEGPPTTSNKYYWNFQDKVFSDEKNPKNVFSSPGTYNVTLQETASGPIIGTVTIKVFNEPDLKINVTNGCAPFNAQLDNVSIIDPGIKIGKYVWVYGDGLSEENLGNPKHIYKIPGVYDVSLNLQTESPNCSRTKIFPKATEILAAPVASFATNPPSGSTCDDKADVSFIDQSTGVKPLTYSWILGNAKTSTLQNPGVQSYISGQYNTSLTVSYNEIIGCTSTFNKTISIGSPKPNIVTKDTICLSGFTKFKTTVPGFYKWDFGTGASSSSVNRDSAFVVFSSPGTKTISLGLTSLDGKCSGSTTKDIFVQDISVKIETSPTFSCNNNALVKYKAISSVNDLIYKWNFSNGKIDSIANTENTYITGTDTIYYDRNVLEVNNTKLTVISKSSQCRASVTAIDTLWIPNSIFSPTVTKGCSPLNTVFIDSSTTAPKNPIVKWKWIMGDGNVIEKNDKSSVTYVYTKPGKYLPRLVVTTKMGCTDTSFANLIEVGENVTNQIDFTVSNKDVCLNTPVDFSATIPQNLQNKISAYHFSTEGNRLSHCFADNKTTWSYTKEIGAQDVALAVDYNGCISTLSKKSFINVKGAVAQIDYASVCSTPLSYTFKSVSLNATKLSWNISDGTSSTENTLPHKFVKKGIYTVKLTASNETSGCLATVNEKIVKVREIKSKINIDTLLCIGNFYSFRGSASSDVYAQCNTGYTWQFPSSGKRPHTSDQPNALFAFDKPGIQKAVLIVKDENGCRDTSSKIFKVYKMVVKAKSDDLDNKICNPATVAFTNQSIGDTLLTKWNWNFGEGSVSSDTNPTHKFLVKPFTKDLIYKVHLTVTDILGCTDTVNIPLEYYKPISKISAMPTPNLCLGMPVTLTAADYTTAGSNLLYKWDFGNRLKDSLQSKTLTYDSAKSYKVVLTYTEKSSNCSGDTFLFVRLQDYPIAGISTDVDALAVLCAPQNVFFKDASKSNFALTHFWDFGNKQNSTEKDFSLAYAKGNYTVRHLVSTSYGCRDTVSRFFKVFKPEGNFTISRDIICKGESITFNIKDTVDVGSIAWAFGDGNLSNNENPVTHQYNFHPPTGQTIAKLILRGAQGICPVDVFKTINIRQVIANFDRNNGGDTSTCFNDGPYPITDKSIAIQNYSWNFGDGQKSTVANPGSHVYEKPGQYVVTLSGSDNTTGCKDTISKKIIIYKNPVLKAIGDTVCQGKTAQLQVLNIDSTSKYLWSPSNGLNSITSYNPIANIAKTLVYQVEQTDTNNCKDKKDIAAVIIEPSNLNDWDTTLIIGDSARLPVYGQKVYNFQWTPTKGLSCTNCNYPWARPLGDTTYRLKVTDVRNCFTAEYDFKIYIKPETFVKLPNTFTPNDDHINDTIYVQGWGIKELLEFQIFNRWGQMLFVSSDLNLGWDGKFNGVLQNSDMYVYKVKVRTWREEILYNEGYINLLH